MLKINLINRKIRLYVGDNMKKLLFGLPVTALAASAVFLAAQASCGTVCVVAATVPDSISAKASPAPTAGLDNPAVTMQDWQVTAKKTRGSKFTP